jgi:HK97 family phage prohead protease
MLNELETRAICKPGEVIRAKDSGPVKIAGYGSMFEERTELWPGFFEMFERGSFPDEVLDNDVRFLRDHDPSLLLGRNKAQPTPTLELDTDETGLRYTNTPPNTQLAADTIELLSRGDLSGSSIRFAVPSDGEEWEFKGETVTRHITRVAALADVSVVTYPQYTGTQAFTARSKDSFVERAKQALKDKAKVLKPILEWERQNEIYRRRATRF